MKTTINVKGMHCEHCSARVEKALSTLGYTVSVSLETGEVTLEKENVNINEVKETVEDLGFEVR